ncbi:uncharacterized protein LOC125229369 [Leguminivora glycinivorella]|uniref:uncharacterized protein LOC125229369 n=1 Tax=Leguminivora glycinivorella TaxID=1035111 RepID=UPI00200F7F9E|nr:uncharacterized protein LOC125229369 [Leguminivora glycinivorella]
MHLFDMLFLNKEGLAGEEEGEEEEWGVGSGARLLRALLPAAAEWGAARALLADAADRQLLLQHLLASPTGSGAAARWREQQAAALVLRARRGTAAARELSRRYPDNALLALVSSGTPLWSHAAAADAGAEPARALGAAWPALLAAAALAPAAAGVLARRLRRRGEARAAAALPWALRLEAEARAPHPRLEYVAHAAMDALPAHKWLTVRCAALGAAGGGGALADVLLERGLRLHALPLELRPLEPQDAPSSRRLHALPLELRPLEPQDAPSSRRLHALPLELRPLEPQDAPRRAE